MDSTHDDLVRQVKGTAADLERLVALWGGDRDCTADEVAFLAGRGVSVDALEADPDDASYDDEAVFEAARDALDGWALELVEHGKRSPGGDWEGTHVVAVFCIGGPHVELDTGKRAVVGYWSGDRTTWGVSSDVVEYFENLVEL